MAAVVLGAKAAVAVLLLVAGGAKFADLSGFAAAIRVFLPLRVPAIVSSAAQEAAVAIAAVEVVVGGISLCWPAAAWANRAVLAVACGFVVVAAVGYARHRDRPCRCFGALARRGFGLRTFLQAVLITAAAALAMASVRPAQVQLTLATHLLLAGAAAIMVVASCTAARAVAMVETRPGMAS
jgi:hypothetical protein